MAAIVPLAPTHAAAAARLHCEALPGYFLPALGPSVLEALYRAIVDLGAGFGFVTLDGSGRLDGFVLATVDTRRLFGRVMRRRWYELLPLVAARAVVRPSLWLKLLETALYPGRAQAAAPLPELLVIAVRADTRRGGVGRGLVAALEERLRALDARRYEVSVARQGTGAQAFYKALGFEEARVFRMYGDEWLALEKELA